MPQLALGSPRETAWHRAELLNGRSRQLQTSGPAASTLAARLGCRFRVLGLESAQEITPLLKAGPRLLPSNTIALGHFLANPRSGR